MRRTLRRTLKEGHERVAVVCGAWHVPALRAKVPATRDDRTLRGLPKTRVAMTWVPWTHGRLAGRSGYGAGSAPRLVPPPVHGARPADRALAHGRRPRPARGGPARLLRARDRSRPARRALAALRRRPSPGWTRSPEATRAVLCEGAASP